MKEKLTIIKVGGKIVEEADTLDRLLSGFSALPGNKLLVHGGGRSATRIAARLGIESQLVNGRRITDAETLKVVTMVYGGLVNKNIVAGLQAKGVNAIGLTGADMDVIRSVKLCGRCRAGGCRCVGCSYPKRSGSGDGSAYPRRARAYP